MPSITGPDGDVYELPYWRKLSFAFGDFANNLYFTTASFFLLYYYTDYLGLTPAEGGWVFAVALIWDAIFDPFMGYLANRTSSVWGRYRPYLLFGAVPLALSWILIFVPTGLKGPQLLLFALVAHMLFRTCYAVVGTPYQAMNAVLTRSSDERGQIAAMRMIFAALCGLAAAFATLKLVEAFGGRQGGFLQTAVIYSGIATLIYLVVFLTTREPQRALPSHNKPLGAGDILRMLRANRAFWLVAAATLVGAAGSTIFNKTLPYFLKYSLHQSHLIGPALTVGAAGVALSIPFWHYVMRKTSKRTMWLCGIAINLLVYAVLWFLPARGELWLLAIAPGGFGAGASFLGFWSTIPDTVEYGAFKSGIKAEGAIFGLVLLIEKSALGLAAGILGELLEAAGYKANQPQTAVTLHDIKLVLLVVPAACALISGIFVFCYPIDRRLHARLNRVLERRARQG